MLTHLLLFRPKADLETQDRAALVSVLRQALRSIPSIRGARIGRRVMNGRPYEQAMRVNYEFAALLEFDDVAGLKAYLEHPAHDALAARFFSVVDDALIYDFELVEGEEGLANLA